MHENAHISAFFKLGKCNTAGFCCTHVIYGSTLTNVNFDADRFPSMIKQAVEYREQMKQLYESQCKQAGTSPREFSQSEATWMPAADMWTGPTEQLEAEGSCQCVRVCG